MRLKELIWISSSKKDLLKFSDDIVQSMGYGLYIAQKGGQAENTKALKGFGGANVIEIIDSDASGTYRVVYCVKMAEVVFVLNVFQKKSKHGIKTPQEEILLVKSRLKLAEEIYKERNKNEKK